MVVLVRFFFSFLWPTAQHNYLTRSGFYQSLFSVLWHENYNVLLFRCLEYPAPVLQAQTRSYGTGCPSYLIFCVLMRSRSARLLSSVHLTNGFITAYCALVVSIRKRRLSEIQCRTDLLSFWGLGGEVPGII